MADLSTNHCASSSDVASSYSDHTLIAAASSTCSDLDDDGVNGDRMKPLACIDDMVSAGYIHKGATARLPSQRKRKDFVVINPSKILSAISPCSKARHSERNCSNKEQTEEYGLESQPKSRRKVQLLKNKIEHHEGNIYERNSKSSSASSKKTDTKPPVYPKFTKSNVQGRRFCVNKDPQLASHVPYTSVKIENPEDYNSQDAGSASNTLVIDGYKLAQPEMILLSSMNSTKAHADPSHAHLQKECLSIETDRKLEADSFFSDDGVRKNVVKHEDHSQRQKKVKHCSMENQNAAEESQEEQRKELETCLSSRRNQVHISSRDSTAGRMLGRLDIGIINRVRDKNQVYAALGAIIGVTIQRNSQSHGEELSHEECSRPARSKARVHSVASHKCGGKRHQQEQVVQDVEETEMDKDADHKKRYASPNRHRNDPMREFRYAEVACSTDGRDSGSVDNVAAGSKSMAAVDAASCWLELLRLDVKGRLSALKRSRRRLRHVLLSGQLGEKTTSSSGSSYQLKEPIAWHNAGKDKWSELHKWRAFFLNMDGALFSEGVRLENWLGQIADMQNHCEEKGFSRGG